MNSLEFIEKQIDVVKKQLAKYPLSKEQSDQDYKHKEADIQYIHNKYYTEQLQILEQIKSELEAWKVVKDEIKVIEVPNYFYPQYCICLRTMKGSINKEKYERLKKSLEVEE